MKRFLLFALTGLLLIPAMAQERDQQFASGDGLDGMASADTAKMFFSAIYPNPANNLATIDYVLRAGQTGVEFVLYDLLGTKVKEIEITETMGSLKVNTSGLTEGIYFYSLLIDNESILTQKLVIKH